VQLTRKSIRTIFDFFFVDRWNDKVIINSHK